MTNRSQAIRTDHCYPAGATNDSSICFNDLPQDILYTIVSKLPPKEFARTSILSHQWRSMFSTICPRLTFNAATVYNNDKEDWNRQVQKFITEVDSILQKHQGKVVETLEFKVDFVNSRLLADHINNWVDFAVSSRTKSLTLDLRPRRFWEYDDRYVFPFQHRDDEGCNMSSLQHMQLSFVSLDSPSSHFRGFGNLKKLHLQTVGVNGKNLQHVLSRCWNLEWLHLDRCQDLKDELIMDGPLTHLLHLRVEYCINITKMKFHAANLTTFEYGGYSIPMDLTQSLKLQSAHIMLHGRTAFQHALAPLLNGFPSVKKLTLDVRLLCLEKQLLWNNLLKSYNLRRLHLVMIIFSESCDKVLHLLSFLRAMPLIEELVIDFCGYALWLAEVGPRREDLGQSCKFNYLKNICITGFKAARGQLEFLLYLVENAPALEVVNIKISHREASKEFWPYEDRAPPFEKAMWIIMNCLLPLNIKFNVAF